MKLLLVLAAASLASSAKLDKTYLPPNAQTSGGSGNFLETPLSGSLTPGYGGPSRSLTQTYYGNNGFPLNEEYTQNTVNYGQNGQNFAIAERPRAALERGAAILRQYNENNGDNFEYAFETENGIYAEEKGVATNGVEAQGSYSYTGDDGQTYTVRYTADQNGFVPQGDHLPTPPPIPEEILKALEQNARDEAAGIYDDGSYNEAKYGDNTSQYGNSYNGNNYNGNVNNGNTFNDDSVVTNSALFGPGLSGSVSGFRNQNGNGLKTYLPPVRSLGNARNGFGARPSFNARSGYQY